MQGDLNFQTHKGIIYEEFYYLKHNLEGKREMSSNFLLVYTIHIYNYDLKNIYI